MHSHTISTPHLDHCIHDFEEEPGAVLHRAAISIGSLVGFVLQKLVDEIAIGRMQFDPVESSHLRPLGAPAKIIDNSGNL